MKISDNIAELIDGATLPAVAVYLVALVVGSLFIFGFWG